MKLLFFAQSADWMNRRDLETPVARPTALRDLVASRPELAPILKNQKHLKVAVNCEYSSFDTEVQDGDEVAFLPPVSGG